MNSKIINTMWSFSLMAISIATIILAGANIVAIELPDIIVRVLGVIDFVSLPVFVFSTVKKNKKVFIENDFFSDIISPDKNK